jgi:transposase
MEMATTRTVLREQLAAKPGDLYMSLELGDKHWHISIGEDRHSVSHYIVEAGHTEEVADCIAKAAARSPTSVKTRVHSCYEAGRDGWWLHRWLCELGVDNIVVDPASIEVNRRARRAKTDRLDADKLLAMLVRHHSGERVWSVLREPSPSDEDARRAHRELQRLTHERIAHTNRISSLLVLHNLRPRIVIGGRDWPAWWNEHREQVPPALRAELERETGRLKLVKEQVRAIEAARARELADGKQPLVAQLARLRAIGSKGAWVLVKEVFGWRHFANRRELAGSLGLAPTPYASGDSEIEQGISKGRIHHRCSPTHPVTFMATIVQSSSNGRPAANRSSAANTASIIDSGAMYPFDTITSSRPRTPKKSPASLHASVMPSV